LKLTSFVLAPQCSLLKQYVYLPSSVAVKEWSLDEVRQCTAHPEINLQIPASAKLAVADLEGNRHLVVLVQRLVEAFALVRLHLDVVRGGERDEAARGSEDGERGKQHGWPRAVSCCAVVLCWCLEASSLGSSPCGNGQVARNAAGVAKAVCALPTSSELVSSSALPDHDHA
jgi:hypothetical protein